MSMFVYEGGGGTQGSVYVDKTDTYQFQKMLIVKYQFLLLLEVRQQSQFPYGSTYRMSEYDCAYQYNQNLWDD